VSVHIKGLLCDTRHTGVTHLTPDRRESFKCENDVTQLLKVFQNNPEAKSNAAQWKTSQKK